MQLILDNISAIMIGSAVILIVLSTQFQAQRSAVEQTVAYASKQSTLQTGLAIEEDLAALGNGTASTVTDVQTNADGLTTVFEFWKQDAGGADMEVTYRLTPGNKVVVRSDSVQLYTLDRFENDVWAGGVFALDMLDSGGNVTVSAGSARLVRATLVNVYPFGEDDGSSVFQTHWGITIRPIGLQN